MRAIEDHGTGLGMTDGHGDPNETPGALVDALKTMGLEDLDPADIAHEFRDPLVRLASSWRAAIAEATLSTRRSDLRRFSRWCVQQLEIPFVSDAGLADLVERHLADCGQTYAPGTTKRIGSNLTALARGVGSDVSAGIAQDCRARATKAAQKRRRMLGVQSQKAHITVSQMQRLREAIAAEAASSTLATRDLAVFDAACDLLASRSEIIKLCLRDLNPREGTIRFSGARADQIDRGAVFALAPRTVASIGTWLDASDLRDFDVGDAGALPLFVGVMNGGNIRFGADGTPEPMNGKTVVRALQRYAARLGISGVAGHSLRRSMARALYEAGVPEEEIVRKGRWSSLSQMREYVGLTAPIQGASDLIF